MGCKKILLICLILCLAFTISAVSAIDADGMDTNKTLSASTDDVVQESDGSLSLSVSNDADVLADATGNGGSFSDLQTLINSNTGTITLTGNYTYGGSDTGNAGISIKKDITIVGRGNIVIDAKEKSRIFNIEGATVTLKGITLSNGKTNDNGGAITSNSALNIENCKLINNTASSGGAIFSSAGDVIMNHSSFYNNKATSASGKTGGGVIYKSYSNSNSKMTFDDCEVYKNYAQVVGGAICTYGSIVLINNSRFHENSALSHGGDFFGENQNKYSFTAYNSSFNSSKSDAYGGSLYFNTGFKSDATINIDKCNFTYDYAKSGGGAIRFMENCEWVYIYNCHFINCTTTNEGGAISQNKAGFNFKFVNLTCINCSQTGGPSTYGGGAITFVCIYTSLELDNIKFINCSAGSRGGGLLYLVSNDNQYVTDNAHYKDLYFLNCTSSGYGGGAFATSMVSNSHPTVFANATIINCSKLGNNGYYGGGAIYWSDPHSTLDNITIINSSSNSAGGAIYLTGLYTTLKNINITNTKTGTSGGAIYWNGPYGTLNNITIQNSKAKGSGGAIYISGAHTKISDVNMTNTTSTSNGGAVYIDADYIDMDNINVVNASATNFGGAVYGGTYINNHITDSTFIKSTAYNGGAFYYAGSSGSLSYIDNCTFIENTASHNGGAIYYVVDDHDGSPYVVYRDYNNFDGRGDNSTGRTNVVLVSYSGSSYTNRIHNSYFKDNKDYLLDVSSAAATDTLMGIINISSPNDPDRDSYRIVLNITHNGELVTQMILSTLAEYSTYYNPIYQKFIINVRNNLAANTEYNVTVGFEDDNYLFKSSNTSFKTGDTWDRGDFLILQALIENAINNGRVLDLTRSYIFTAIEDHASVHEPDKSCMNITRPIIINGNGFTLDALGYSRIFNITANNVILNNINFVNGNASGIYGDNVKNGGAIYWAGQNGVINASNIRYNFAEYGGGIYLANSASTCKIDDCLFELNNATYNGGAIDCNASQMRLTNTEFVENTAKYGAALCREANATKGSGINNRFVKNHATYAGAALAWMKAESIYIDTYTFIDNTADYSGGAIYVGERSDNCVIFNSTFTGNNITNPSSTGHGGAIEWYAEYGNVMNSTFINNNAPTGGAIYVGSASGNVNITNSGFLRNNALTVGGAIDLAASSVLVNNSYFRENTAANGGAIFVGGIGVDNAIYHSYFTSNNATDGKGGAVNWNASAGNIYDTNFTGNNANYGGAVYIGGHSSNSRIVNVTFTSNNATYNGGAIDWNATGGQLYNTTFISNYAGEYGAALCRESGATGGSGKNNTFIKNHAEIAGAALAWLNVQGIRINTYYFYDNTVHQSGGAIYIGEGSDNCAVINSIFEGNNVTNETGGHGGAIDVVANNAELINSSFTNNNAYYGGAVWLGGDSGNNNITNTNFTNNHAVMDGGAINLRASAVTIRDANFSDNTAGRNGGALYVSGTGTTNVIYTSVFERNTAGGDGGAIDWRAAAGHIEESNFTSNKANYGGAIYLNGVSSHSNITKVIFKDNRAAYNGGAIDCNASFMNLTYTKFILNYAGEYGAALCRESNATNGSGHHNDFISNHADISGAALAWLGVKNIKINYYNFINNTAGFSGGAIYSGSGSDNCLINNSYFKGNHITNSTGGHGGAIDIVSDDSTIINSNFTENEAFYGGAIFVGSQSGHTNIINVTFTKNTADKDGGAIYLVASGVDLKDARLYNNTAANNGGAVYVGGTGTTNIIEDSVFDNNQAGNRGGAVDWLASKGEILNSNFTRNSATSGGALYLNGISSNSILSHLIFANNTATANGGAIDCNATMVNLTHTQFLSNYANYGAALCRESGATGGFGVNNTFIKNHAYTSGAALAWLGVGNIHINNYTFINNTADFSGAAIYVSEGSENCIVDNSTFTDNYVSNALTGRGGAIDWLGNNGTVMNSNFTECISAKGGAIYVGENSNNMTIDNVKFILCNSLTDGGSIVVYGDDFTAHNSTFISSIAMDNGGAIAGFNSDNANITNCTFKYNHVAGHTLPDGTIYGEGGAIYWENSKNLHVSDSRFISNEAHLSGGSISADNCNDSVVYNITTHDETAFRNGGSIAWINSHNVTIEKGKFNDSGANYRGGTIYLGNVYDITVKNGEITESYASWDYGGGIYVDGNATIENMVFEDTHSDDEYGTAIYFHSGNSTVLNSKFENLNNAILVNKSAEVHLVKNNLTANAPNNGMMYLRDDVENIASLVYYSVWNDGDLYLEGNNFDYVIFNNGTIWTNTTTKMLNNGSYEVEWNQNFTFFANITDDNKNNIISVRTLIATNDVAQDSGSSYNIYYNRITLPCIYQGVFHLQPEDSGLKKNTLYNGTLKVKMPVDLKLSVSYADATKEHVIVTATLIPKAASNFTVNDVVSLKIGDKFYGNASINGATASWTIATAEWNLNNLSAGTYTLTATYAGDDVHYGIFNTTSFEIELRKIWIKVHADNILYGAAAVINITSNATNGTVVISINGKSRGVVQLVNGSAIYTLPNFMFTELLDPNEYSVAVVYTGNDYYDFQMNESSFIVYKLATNIEINHNLTIEFGDKETVIVTVNDTYSGLNATGFVKITINNEEYFKKLDANGKATFNIYELANGTYTDIPVEYAGDNYYNASSNKFSFTVGATTGYDMNVHVENITYGQNATIYVTLPSGVTNNLTIYVNNTPYYNVSVTKGVAKLVVPNLDAGDYVVNATYNGDEKYAVSYNNGTVFNVAKLNTYTMNVTAVDVKVDQNTTITVYVPKDAAGSVILWVNQTRLVNSTIVDGVATFTLNNTLAGRYSVNATLADENYLNQTVYTTYTVSKHETPISINEITAIEVGDSAQITVNAPQGILSNVTIEIDGVKYNKTIDADGKATFTVPILSNGTKTVVASYSGDRKYMANSTTAKLTATRKASFVNATDATITVGDVAKINITGPGDYNGFATVKVNGTVYSVALTNGKGQLNVTGLGNATHTVYVTLLENGKYNSSSNDSARIFVNKVEDTQIDANVENTTFGEPVVVKVTVPDDATGNVTVVIGNITKTVTIGGGENEIIVPGVPAGEYNVTVKYNGDDKYAPANTTEKLKVSPVNITDDIKVIDQGNGTVVVIVPGNATGNVTVKVGNDTYNATVINGTAIINMTNATPGSHNVTVIYSGDGNHTNATLNATVTIPKHLTPISIEVANIFVGGIAEIVVRVPANVTNNVTIEIDGVKYNKTAVNGVATFEIEGLTAGNKTVAAIYYADGNYSFNSTTKQFKVEKLSSKVNATDATIIVGEVAKINITGPGDYNGIISVRVNGTVYSVTLTNGRGQLNITGLGNATHTVYVTLLENGKYNSSSNDSARIYVNKVTDAVIDASVENTTEDKPVIVKVTVPDDATGNVTVVIGNITKKVPIAGGENEIIVPGVPAGEYNVTVTYNGDDKYGPVNTTEKLNVTKVNKTSGVVQVIDQGNGTVVVVVPGNATGNVTVKLGNDTYNATVINGTAVVNMTNATPGKHNITVIYTGDDTHDGVELNTTVNIPKHATPISIEVNNIVVGGIAEIVVRVPANVTNNVTIEIDGVKYNKTAVNGVATFEIEGLTAGNKTVAAIYYADGNYSFNSTTKQFKVEKVSSKVNATDVTITVGDVAKINITGPGDYNGFASVKVNGTVYSVVLTNGKGQLNVTGLGNATHIVYVTLLENAKYDSSSNDSARIYVNKVEDTAISASVENTTFGEPVVVKVNVPVDATGNVTVIIGNITKTVTIGGGENEIIVPGVPAGEYNVTVKYNGDDKYTPANTTEKLKVSPVNITDDIKVIDQGNGTVVVIVPGNATGNVTVKVGNDTYNATVINGTAIINMTNATPGSHNVTVIYSGDGNHTNATLNATVNIPKHATPIFIEVKDSNVGNFTRIVVAVPANVTGNVTVEIDSENYTAKADDGIAIFDIGGLTAGSKTVTATYVGDDEYLFNSTTRQFNVFKNNVSFTVSATVNEDGRSAVIKVSGLPSDAKGYVIVDVNGTEFGINIASSKQITIPIVKSGNYTVNAKYLGDDKYLTNVSKTTFDSHIVSNDTTISVENTTVGQPVIVKVTVPDDATGNVTVILDGNVTKVVEVTGGENIIEIPGVSEGTHGINVTYSGDDQYPSKILVTNVTVFKSIIADEHLKRGWNSPYDYQAEFFGKDGHILPNTYVQFIVNGKTYTVKTDEEGIAYLKESQLPVGTYDITVINPVTGEQVTNKVTIVIRLTESKDITMEFVDGTYFVVRAIGDDGNPVGEGEFVDIYVNTIHYSCRTDKDGYARLKINLNPKSYTVRSEYKLTKITNKLVVKQTLKLVKKTVSVKKGKNLVLKATLKWANGKAIKGKTIKFAFNKKTYTAKTNSKGIAKVTVKAKIIKKLKTGKKYAYSAKYLTNVVKGKVKVK